MMLGRAASPSPIINQMQALAEGALYQVRLYEKMQNAEIALIFYGQAKVAFRSIINPLIIFKDFCNSPGTTYCHRKEGLHNILLAKMFGQRLCCSCTAIFGQFSCCIFNI